LILSPEYSEWLVILVYFVDVDFFEIDTNQNQTLMTTIPALTTGIKIQLYTALCPRAKHATTPEKSMT
jgi:hypothetical protein